MIEGYQLGGGLSKELSLLVELAQDRTTQRISIAAEAWDPRERIFASLGQPQASDEQRLCPGELSAPGGILPSGIIQKWNPRWTDQSPQLPECNRSGLGPKHRVKQQETKGKIE